MQLHAPDADFATTVLKARAYVEAHEGAKPKKSVRIITPPPDHTTPVVSEDNPSFVQPLLQGFRDVLKERFSPASVQTSIVAVIPIHRLDPGATLIARLDVECSVSSR